ncbi:3-hydroxyacyl-CoA dehydrogenase NAD-binding domain-containing protein [Pigmentiphaga soli]|uniref:3-hydroxyacyl-CoA dehydrogenase NAD-binding domain-containing protein n=1 Tax=Pigmentiphaga soli TaxID=1007095 RepID=A0ABP8GUD1_9BURK
MADETLKETAKAPLKRPADTRVLVIGAGTMGSGIAEVFGRAGCETTIVEPDPARRQAALARLEQIGARCKAAPAPEEADLPAIDLAVECAPERLALKQALFGQLARRLRPDALLCSNSSSFPISDIAQGLPGPERMLGLHFFMPAPRIPLVEVVLGAGSSPALGEALCDFMRDCGMVPVLVRKDLPGFLANRLQHALAREAFALVDAGIVSPEDVDAAVRFGFGMRFLAAGPMLQRDHNGLDVHHAAAASIYPSLANDTQPGPMLSALAAAGKFGLKSGAGIYDWQGGKAAAERRRYDQALEAALAQLARDLPPRQAGQD